MLRSTRLRAVVAAGALFAAATGVVGMDAAQAHTCTAQDPPRDCGRCRSGTHVHTYTNGTLFCASEENPVTGTTCVPGPGFTASEAC